MNKSIINHIQKVSGQPKTKFTVSQCSLFRNFINFNILSLAFPICFMMCLATSKLNEWMFFVHGLSTKPQGPQIRFHSLQLQGPLAHQPLIHMTDPWEWDEFTY